MTDNEKKAREIMDFSFLANLVAGNLDVALPALTDEECKKIAINYPRSFQEIRTTFPRVKL